MKGALSLLVLAALLLAMILLGSWIGWNLSHPEGEAPATPSNFHAK